MAVFVVGLLMAKLTMAKDRGGQVQLAGVGLWVFSIGMCGVSVLSNSNRTAPGAAPAPATTGGAGAGAPAASGAATTNKDATCLADLKCWGEKHVIAASVRCDDAVERLAKYSHKWTDGLLEPKFSHYRWKNRATGVVTYIGDKIQFQNGFGAFQNHIYECDFDPRSEEVLDVRARPGRL
jgi:hypothetical protein